MSHMDQTLPSSLGAARPLPPSAPSIRRAGSVPLVVALMAPHRDAVVALMAPGSGDDVETIVTTVAVVPRVLH